MAVTGVNDYTKRLAENRARYNDSAQELRESYQKRFKDKEAQHLKVRENQRQTYLKEKEGLERTHRQNLDNYSNKLKQTLEQQKNRCRQDLVDKGKVNEEERKKLVEGYSDKLEELTKSLEESRRQDKMAMERQRERLRNVERATKKAVNERYNREKGDLLRATQTDKNKLKQKHRQEFEKMRESHSNELSDQKNIAEDVRQELLKTKRTDLRRQQNNFENTIQDFAERGEERLANLAEMKEAEKDQLKELLRDRSDDLAKKMKTLNNEKDSRLWADLQKEILWENRVKGLLGEMRDQNRRHQVTTERMAADQTAALRELEKDYRQATDQLKLDMSKTQQRKIASLSKKFDSRDRDRIRQQRYLKSEFEGQHISEKRKHKNNTKRLKGDYERKFNSMQDFHLQNMEDYKRELSEERSEVIEKSKVRSAEEQLQLREKLKTNYAERENALYKKIEEEKLGHMVELDKYAEKLERFKDKAIEEIEQSRMIEHIRRKEDKKKNDYDRKLASATSRQEKINLHNEMEKRLMKSKIDADTNVAKLVKKYENLLRRERIEFQKELARRDGMSQFEKMRLQKSAEDMQNKLIHQYETKIEEIKEQFKKQAS